MIFSCTFAVPPSVNSMYIERKQAGKRGRSLSWEYRAWRDSVRGVIAQAWREAGSQEVPKPFVVHLQLGIDHKGDIDNRTKAALDALCKAVPTPGDQWIDVLHVTRGGKSGMASLSVYPMGEP